MIYERAQTLEQLEQAARIRNEAERIRASIEAAEQERNA